MPGSVWIEAHHLEKKRASLAVLIKKSGLPRFIQDIAPGTYGWTAEGIRFLEILETSLAILWEVEKQLEQGNRSRRRGADKQKETDPHKQPNKDETPVLSGFLIRVTGIYVMCAYALKELKLLENPQETGIVTVKGGFKREEIVSLIKDSPSVFLALLDDFYRYLRFYRQHPHKDKRLDSSSKVINCSVAYFTLLKNSMDEMLREGKYEEEIKNMRISILGKEL